MSFKYCPAYFGITVAFLMMVWGAWLDSIVMKRNTLKKGC